jgi:hypothetical protein
MTYLSRPIEIRWLRSNVRYSNYYSVVNNICYNVVYLDRSQPHNQE